MGDAVIAAMTGMAMCFGYVPAVPPSGAARSDAPPDGRTANAPTAAPADARPRTWRDDAAFAAIVDPLAGDLRWRLRVRRLLLRTTVGPALRVAALVAGFMVAVGGTATMLVFLGASLADAYGTPMRWALRPLA
jgi:hypothetical protein